MDAVRCSIAVFAAHPRAAAGQESRTSAVVHRRHAPASGPNAGSSPMGAARCSIAETVCHPRAAVRTALPTDANANRRPVRRKAQTAAPSATAVSTCSCAVSVPEPTLAALAGPTDAGRGPARRRHAPGLVTIAATRPTTAVAPCTAELAKRRAPAAEAAVPTIVAARPKLATRSARNAATPITDAARRSIAGCAKAKRFVPATCASNLEPSSKRDIAVFFRR